MADNITNLSKDEIAKLSWEEKDKLFKQIVVGILKRNKMGTEEDIKYLEEHI
jgi:hypothetical protein